MRACTSAVTILVSCLLLLLSACEVPVRPAAELPKRYDYEIYLSQMGRSFHLLPKPRRYASFAHRPTPPAV